MYKKYSMKNASEVSSQGAQEIESYLRTLDDTIEVINVENDSAYRIKDIDLIWVRRIDGVEIETTIEIKADRYYHTGNYFFETISNEGKNTQGCFMYTKADFIYYYFIEQKELHILPMPETRDWFIPLLEDFKETRTSTPVGNGGHYVTAGRLVPRQRVIDEVAGVRIIEAL